MLPPIGEVLTIHQGAFAGFTGRVLAVDGERESVNLEVQIFGRATTIWQTFAEVDWLVPMARETLQDDVDALQSPTLAARRRAARALGARGSRAVLALPDLSVVLAQDPRAEVRAAAALALGDIRPRAVQGALRAALQDRSRVVVVAALQALRRLDARSTEPETVAALRQVLARPQEDTQEAAVRAMVAVQSGTEDDVMSLAGVVSQGASLRVRGLAAYALARLGSAAQPATAALLDLLAETDVDRNTRGFVYFALGRMHATGVLHARLDGELPLEERQQALIALCSCRDASRLEDIREALLAGDLDLRRQLIGSLYSLGEDMLPLEPSLVELAHTEALLAPSIVETLSTLSADAVVALARHPDAAVRQQVLKALSPSWTPLSAQGLAMLRAALLDTDADVRRVAAERLAERLAEIPEARPALLAARDVESEDWVRGYMDSLLARERR